MSIVKQFDTRGKIEYKLPIEQYRFLEGAKVKFLLEKQDRTLLIEGDAVIEDMAQGILSYTLKAGDAISVGKHYGEFQIDFADGTFASYPKRGFLSVEINRSIDTGRETEFEERVAIKVSLIDEKFDDMESKNEAFKNDFAESYAVFKSEIEALGHNISSLNEQQRAELDQRMGTTENKVAAVKEEQSFQEKRIDNIMAESGNDSASAAEIRDAHLGADGVARPNLGSMMREMHKQQIDANAQTTQLKRGLNLVQSDQSSPTTFEIYGQTRVNLFGNGRTTQSKTVTVSPTSRYLFIKRNLLTGAVAKEFITGVESVNRSWVADEWAALFQLTTAEYTEALTLTDAQLTEKYPYIDGVQHVRNPVVTKKGKNLLPPLHEWILSGSGAVIENIAPYNIKMNSTAAWRKLFYRLPIIANESYTFSYERVQGEYYYARMYNGSTQIGAAFEITNGRRTLVIPSNITHVEYSCEVPRANEGFEFKNPMMVVGTSATPFQPQNNDHLYFPDTLLGSSLDGAVRDSIYKKDGKYVVRERLKKDVVLDGSLNWFFGNYYEAQGYSRVYALEVAPNRKEDFLCYVIDQNGRLYNGGQTHNTSGGKVSVDSTGRLYISLSNEITGWSGTKTNQQIKDFFQANPMKLTYELSTPEERELTVEGEIGFHSGANLVELGEGVMYTEKDGKRTYTIIPSNQKYNMTTAVTKATATYNTNHKTVQDALVQGQTDMKAQVNVQALQLLEVFARLRAGGI